MEQRRRIADFVRVSPRFLRSVNLANDWRSTESFDGYIVTPNVSSILERLNQGLSMENGQRAFTLIGPYGTGKSAFAVYLCQLLGRETESATRARVLLTGADNELGANLARLRGSGGAKRGFLPIPITARRRPIAQLLLEGLERAVAELNRAASVDQLAERIQAAQDHDYWKDTATLLKFIKELADEAKSQGYAGLLLMIDEAGKTLEYALQDREGGDVYVFQEIAEFANRQQEFPLLFLIILHQMFDDYVELAERTIRAEWTKVQERFQTIQFAESAATTIKMLADALQQTSKLPTTIGKAIDKAMRQLEESSMPLPIGLDRANFRAIARRAWPLHPTVLLAMPHLFRRLAQNERSIFSYLASHEPFGLQEQLERLLDADSGFIRLHDLYAYLLANFEAGLARLPHAKRLLEANDVINSRHTLSPAQHDLIRSIALLNVLGEMCPLRATANFLRCASSIEMNVEAELEKLKQQSIVTYRRLDSSFRVWEGSDVDIDERLKEARRHLQMDGGSLIETLRRHLPERNLVARRHSLETGAHRSFRVVYAEHLLSAANLHELDLSEGAAGQILVVLPTTDAGALKQAAERATRAQPRLIVALPRQIEAIRGVVEDIATLRWVERNTEELRDDRVARRELSLRLVEGEQRITQLLQTLLDPRGAPIGNSCQWFWNGTDQKPESPVDVTKLLSAACDHIYDKSPRLRNELVGRKTISSAASAARRCLLERMLKFASDDALCIDGFPPEKSIYASVLRASEIHAANKKTGAWYFQAPPQDNFAQLRPAWDLLEKEIFSRELERRELKDIFSMLAQPPYGVPEGIHPILFTAFYLVNQDSLFLYRENSFVPDPQSAHFELLQRRADLFAISGARLDGVRGAVVGRLSKGLKTTDKTASVVRALYRIINGLPPITLKSSRFEQSMAIDVRDRFLRASSPEELLFSELPRCFGLEPFLHGENRAQDIEMFFKSLNSCLSALQEHATGAKDAARNQLLESCNLPQDDSGWKSLERRAESMAPLVNNATLTPFLNSVINGIKDDHNPTPALSLVANRSFEQWADIDVDRFPGLAHGIGIQFRRVYQNLGAPGLELTEIEAKQKSKLIDEIQSLLQGLRGKTTNKVLRAALNEVTYKIENEFAEQDLRENTND